MIALKTTVTRSACHGDECVRGSSARGFETIVFFARVKRPPAQRQGQAVLDAEGQAHEQFPGERGGLAMWLDHQERDVAIGVVWPLAVQLDVLERLAEQLMQFVGGEFLDVERVARVSLGGSEGA